MEPIAGIAVQFFDVMEMGRGWDVCKDAGKGSTFHIRAWLVLPRKRVICPRLVSNQLSIAGSGTFYCHSGCWPKPFRYPWRGYP
jgi:hypothetical protein